MELCLYTDSVYQLSFVEAAELAGRIGVRALELAAGGQSPAPHMNLRELLASAPARQELLRTLEANGLRIGALNCSAWPMHPVVGAEHEQLIRDTIRLASELGVDKIVTMSGCPGDGPNSTTFNWVWYPWPEDAVELLERQWQQALDLWGELSELAVNNGVTRIAFELHPLHLVYNVPTLLRFRKSVGEVIGANVDPSHMFWQQMDPIAVVKELGPAVHHVHLKDCELVPERVALAGVLDQTSFRQPAERAWRFRTIGRAHGPEFWAALVSALSEAGYDDVLSIENEDAMQEAVEGVTEAAGLVGGLLRQAVA
jgi:sugar phosphate isomerase/epimerase